MFIQRPIYHYTISPSAYADFKRSVQALSYLDDDDEYDFTGLLSENEELLDGFHIEEEIVHEIDEDVYKMYYEILNERV
jgi:hypothetical protein